MMEIMESSEISNTSFEVTRTIVLTFGFNWSSGFWGEEFFSKVYRRWQTSSDGNTCSSLWSRPAKNESSNEAYLSFWNLNIKCFQGMNENHYTKNIFFIQQQNKIIFLFILHVIKVKLTQYPTRYKINNI